MPPREPETPERNCSQAGRKTITSPVHRLPSALRVCHNSTSKQSASDNGTPGQPGSLAAVFYLVHISVRAASYPLDQLEILLRIPPRQVDTGVHHVRCRSRRRARTTEKRQRYTKTGILRKNIRRQKIPAQIQCRSNMASVCRACALGSMAPLESDQAERATGVENEKCVFELMLCVLPRKAIPNKNRIIYQIHIDIHIHTYISKAEKKNLCVLTTSNMNST